MRPESERWLPPGAVSPGGRPLSDDPAPHLFDRIVALFEVLLCSGFPTQILLMGLLTAAGFRPLDGAGRLSATYVLVLSAADAALLVSLILGLLWLHGESPREVFLGTRRASREAALGLLLVFPTIAFVAAGFALIQRYAPWLHNVPDNPLEALVRTPRDALVFGVVAIVAGGLREEMQRAFVLRRFEAHLGGALVGLAIFSVAFGAGHLIQGRDAALLTALLGVFWGALYLLRRSIMAPALTHAGFNAAEILRQLTLS